MITKSLSRVFARRKLTLNPLITRSVMATDCPGFLSESKCDSYQSILKNF